MDVNDFYDILQKRYSVRQYLKKPVPEEVITRILDVGRQAASAANRQPWAFVLCTGDDKEKLNEIFYREGFKDAPVAIAALAKPKEAWARRYDNKNFACVDVSIAVTEMILAATAEGLGTCWIAAFDVEKAQKILNVPDDMIIVTLLTIGYADPQIPAPERKRKNIAEVIFRGRYKQ